MLPLLHQLKFQFQFQMLQVAVLGAAGAEKLSDPLEARRLIDLLFACENAEVTPGGRRIVVIVGIDEIEKRF